MFTISSRHLIKLNVIWIKCPFELRWNTCLHNYLISLDAFLQKCKERVVTSAQWNTFEGLLNHKSINRYIETCARITWQMATQQIPMWLSTTDTCFDEEKHTLWWSCDRNEAHNVKYFVWPALYDSKDGTLLVKGIVFTENESNGES